MNTLRNSVQLIGRLGQQPEITTFDSGSKIARFSLAVNNGYRDKSGEYVEKTMWVTTVMWAKTAELAEKNLLKGDEVLLTGRLEQKEYNAKDGTKRYATEVVSDSFLRLTKHAKPE